MLRTIFLKLCIEVCWNTWSGDRLEKRTHETMLEGLFARPHIVVKIEFDVYLFDLM